MEDFGLGQFPASPYRKDSDSMMFRESLRDFFHKNFGSADIGTEEGGKEKNALSVTDYGWWIADDRLLAYLQP
jgi:hypothetical protein